jgi:hypothetical protein
VFSSFRSGPEAREKRWLAAIVALHLLAVTLPYLWALAMTPTEFEYSGLLFSPDDQNVHLAWARQAQGGHFFARDLFTTENLGSREKPLFFNALAVLMGTLARLGAPLILVYHALRIGFSMLVLLAFYALSTRFTDDRRARLFALMLAAFSGGTQFLSPLFPNRIFLDKPDGNFPMMPEAFTFASNFIFTLNAAAIALLLISYLCVLTANESENLAMRKHAMLMGFGAALLLSNIHTYDAIPLLITLILWTAWRVKSTPRANWKATAIIACGAVLPVLYQLMVFRGSEEFRLKALTPTPAPPLPDVLLSYGLLVPLAICGAVLAWRAQRENAALRLLMIWAVVTLACIYAPVSFARKMIEGFHLPLCLLSGVGVLALLARLSSPVLRVTATVGVLALCCVSSAQFVAWCLMNASSAPLYNQGRGEIMPPLYLTSGDVGALRFLNRTLSAHDKSTRAVLCWPKLGNYVPRESSAFVYAGHWAETLNLIGTDDPPNKYSQVLDLFTGKMRPTQARSWLRANHIGYVIIGHYERERLNARLPLELPKIFDENGTTIFAVPHEENTPGGIRTPNPGIMSPLL